MVNSGNRGEWAEAYIFLKLASEGKVYIADRRMRKINSSFLKINKIIREEVPGHKTEYIISDTIHVLENSKDIGLEKPTCDYGMYANKIWSMIERSEKGNGLYNLEIAKFLEEIKINKLKSPAHSSSKFFGGTEDIIMEVQNPITGNNTIMSFSCKSKFVSEATVFNASKDNTNFRFRVTGNIDDTVMNTFNSLVHSRNKTDKKTGEVKTEAAIAISERMKYLKKQNCGIEFVRPVSKIAERNLVQSGGQEMPIIIGAMLKYYFFEHNGESEYRNISKILRYLASQNPVKYEFDDLSGMYKTKVGMLLHNMFTGMRMATIWDGRQHVTGGYLCAKRNGDVVAFHVDYADEFRDYLINQLSFEAPSVKKHNYMKIIKDGSEYVIDLNMQVRFTDSEITKIEKEIENLVKKKNKINSKLEKGVVTLNKRINARKPNSNTIMLAEKRVAEVRKELGETEKEIDNCKAELQRIKDGNGSF